MSEAGHGPERRRQLERRRRDPDREPEQPRPAADDRRADPRRSTPIETDGVLQVYNWDAYFYKKVLKAFEDEYDVKVEWTTFNNMEEGIQKLVAGQVTADVFFPTTDYIRRLVASDNLQPLNHELIPNLAANVWPVFSDPGPWYDLEARYTVPYVIYTTGVAYRRDRVEDAQAAELGYDAFFDPAFKDSVAYYDSYRDALGMMLLRNGVTDPDSSDPAAIGAAKDAILEMINDNGARLAINGTYVEALRGRGHGLAVVVGRHRRRQVLPAEGHVRGRARLLVPGGQEGSDRQRHDHDPGERAAPAARARVPELLPRREVGLHELRRTGTGTSRRSRRSIPDRLVADGVVAPALVEGGPGRGGLHAGLHPERADPRGRPDLARRVERDPGRWLAPRRRRGAKRRRERSASDQRTGVDYPRWYWPAFTAPGLIWLLVLFVLPFYVVVSVAFGTVDPFFRTPLPVYQPWWWSFDTFSATLAEVHAGGGIYLDPLIRTLEYVVAASAICLVIGYAVAYYTARFAGKRKGLILVLLVAPFWISYLMRIYAWQSLLQPDGYINDFLGIFRIAPVEWLAGKPITVILGLVYGYIPFMILPLFGSLDRINQSLLEAGRDLGASPFQTFRRVTLPAVEARHPRGPRDRVPADVRRLLHEQPARHARPRRCTATSSTTPSVRPARDRRSGRSC